jgi:CheY-like chemotaxis protein
MVSKRQSLKLGSVEEVRKFTQVVGAGERKPSHQQVPNEVEGHETFNETQATREGGGGEDQERKTAALVDTAILLVDDSAPNRKMLRRLLVNNNLTSGEILEADDGLQCLRIMEEAMAAGREIGIIIMDDSMPNLCGPEAAKELRSRGYSGLICGVTGNILPTDIQRYVDFGATCVLAKPLNLQLLKRQIAKFYSLNLPKDDK